MYLEIDNMQVKNGCVGIDFVFDDDFRRKVANVCKLSYITKKDLQTFIIHTLERVLTEDDLTELRNQID